MTRSPAALTEPVVFPFVTKCKSLPCVILIIDHVIVNHVLLSATPTSLSQAYAYSARNIEEEEEIPTVHGNLIEIVDTLGMEFDLVLRGTASPVTVDVGIVSHVDARELRGPTPPRLAADVTRNVVVTYISVKARRRRCARDPISSP